MHRDQAKELILSRAEEYLTRDKSGKGFICPICGSGSGPKGTGITTKDGIHYTCWKGCFQSADIIDIIGMEQNVTEYKDKLEAAARFFGIEIDRPGDRVPKPRQKRTGGTVQPTQDRLHNPTYTTTPAPVAKPADPEPEVDYTDFFLQAAQDIDKTDYHRGISLETLKKFRVGYVEKWKHPKSPTAPCTPRLIIPTSDTSYLARDTRADVPEEQKAYTKSKVGKVHIFNVEALYSAVKPIFVVEGEIDALSILDVGGEAIALGSVSNRRMLTAHFENKKPSQPLLLALDSDKAGQDGTLKLKADLDKMGITYYTVDVTGGRKDANDALLADRESFAEAVQQAEQIGDKLKEEARQRLLHEAVAYHLDKFKSDIEASKACSYVSTGFHSLDKILDGGLYAGLYIIGAVSSLGKTTFCLEVCDIIAGNGRDVLVFSLEMAKNEIIAKSISRLTFYRHLCEEYSAINAKTTRGILTGAWYDNYSQDEKRYIDEAIEMYRVFSENIYITEGVGDVGVEQIRERVERHVELTGRKPVVLIDYLQILAPADIKATDKQNTDKAVLELKRLSRDYGIPIIGISSFNRENYTSPVNLTSFKESGAIEYSSDVLIGLQYEGMDYEEGETDKARDKRIRELVKNALETGSKGEAQKIQIKVLKNRNGSKGETFVDFYPKYNYFLDRVVDKGKDAGGWEKAKSSFR